MIDQEEPKQATDSPNYARIVIILATARSGSNSLVSYLDSLPGVAGWGELNVFASRSEPVRVTTRLEKQITEPLSEIVENYHEFTDLIAQSDSLQDY